MRFILALLTLPFLLVTTFGGPKESSVVVLCGQSSGSGTAIHQQGRAVYVLTCKHVVSDNAKIRIIQGDKIVKAELVAVGGADLDLALLKAELNCEIAQLGKVQPATGDKITHFGRATGPQSGVTTEDATFGSFGPSTKCTMLSCSGDSGAGVFVNANLVGVNWGRQHFPGAIAPFDEENSTACFVQLSSINEFLNKNLPH